MAKIKTFQILELKSQNCRKNLLVDFPFFILEMVFRYCLEIKEMKELSIKY